MISNCKWCLKQEGQICRIYTADVILPHLQDGVANSEKAYFISVKSKGKFSLQTKVFLSFVNDTSGILDEKKTVSSAKWTGEENLIELRESLACNRKNSRKTFELNTWRIPNRGKLFSFWDSLETPITGFLNKRCSEKLGKTHSGQKSLTPLHILSCEFSRLLQSSFLS